MDLSGLMELVLVFNALFQALLPIALIVGFVGFFALLIGAKLLKRINFAHAGPVEGWKMSPRKRAKKLAVAGLFIVLALSMFATASPAGAINGSIDLGVNQVFGNTPLTAKVYNLDASTAYAIYWGSTAVINWTTAASGDTERIVTFEATPPTSGNTVIIYLYSAATTVDSLTVYIADEEDFFPTDFFINLGITILIFALITVLVAGIVKKKI